MFQYALVQDNGEVQHVVSSGSDSDYTDGQMYHGLTAVRVAYDADAQDLIETKYYVDGSWLTREARSSQWQDWINNEWVFNASAFADNLRFLRNNKLSQTDWTQLADNRLADAERQACATYRQALRDVPAENAGVTSLDSVAWPAPPNA